MDVVVSPPDSVDAAILDVDCELFTVLNVEEYLNLETVTVVALVVDGKLPPSCCCNSCCFCNIFLAVIIIFNARIWRLV